MTALLGLALIGLSIALVKLTKRRELAGSRFWSAAAASTWLPLVFTAMFGLGVVATIGGAFEWLGA